VARLILDTGVFISAERQGRQINRLVADEDDVAIAAITAAELLVGVELADDARRASRASFVRTILDTVPIEDYDEQVAHTHAKLLAHVRRSGRPRGAHDLMIAATALARDRIVVSTDRTAFDELPGVTVRG
jgi:tRNA(fMet)-specific endonuclease VapC